MSKTVKPAYRIPSIVAAICFALAAILFPIHQLLYRSVDVVFDMANPEIVSINSVRAIVNLLITFSFDIIIFVALILLAIFAITAARGKAKTPLFVIGAALWMLGWGLSNLDTHWYYISNIFNADLYFMWGFIKHLVEEAFIHASLIALGIMALVKTKRPLLSLIPSISLGGGFVLMFWFWTYNSITSLLSSISYGYYMSGETAVLTLIRLAILYSYYFLFTGGIIFSSFAAVKRTKKASASMTIAERLHALEDKHNSGTISEEEYATEKAILIEQL
ncbi:MAG: hypothetical protein IKV35_00350 [Clostridia bacterium]|nr:hypothetical protein [Clostridia bacterium]